MANFACIAHPSSPYITRFTREVQYRWISRELIRKLGLVPNPDFLSQVEQQFDKDRKIITACLRGVRSMQAATMMMALGYTQVVDMQGGYDAELDARGNVVVEGWARRNFPTTTD